MKTLEQIAEKWKQICMNCINAGHCIHFGNKPKLLFNGKVCICGCHHNDKLVTKEIFEN